MRRAPARPVRACFVRSCCSVVVQEHDLRATPVQCNAKRRLSSHFTLHSSHPISALLISSVPVLLCTRKLAQSTSQYYFVLRSLRKALCSTTLYYKPCTKYVPALLGDTKFAQRKLLRTASSFAEKLLHTASFLNREAFTHRIFLTQQAFTQRSFYTQQVFTHSKRLHTEHLHTVFLHMASVYTEKLLHTEAFTHKIFYTQEEAFTEKVLTQRSFLVHNHNRNCSSKISAPKQKKRF